MTKEQVEKLVRQILYEFTVEQAIEELYKLLKNKEEGEKE